MPVAITEEVSANALTSSILESVIISLVSKLVPETGYAFRNYYYIITHIS